MLSAANGRPVTSVRHCSLVEALADGRPQRRRQDMGEGHSERGAVRRLQAPELHELASCERQGGALARHLAPLSPWY